jgi:hypothetical protein
MQKTNFFKGRGLSELLLNIRGVEQLCLEHLSVNTTYKRTKITNISKLNVGKRAREEERGREGPHLVLRGNLFHFPWARE